MSAIKISDTRPSQPQPASEMQRTPLTTTQRRRHVLILLAIVAVGLLRGLFWVTVTEMWNPIDETAHFGYVESLATGKGIPIVGRDRVSADEVRSLKLTPTVAFRSNPIDTSRTATATQYEAVQGPVYYALLVPAYWAGRPFGFITSVYAVRVGSVLLSLLAIPLAWMLGRELFPKHPAIWLLAPAGLVLINGFNGNLASVNNDALVVPSTLATILVFLRIRHRLSWRDAALAGLLLAVAVVNKTTALALVPFLAPIAVAAIVAHRRALLPLAKWFAVFVAAGAVVTAPWIVFNLVNYHALSGSDAVGKITGNVQAIQPMNLAGLRWNWHASRVGFWELQTRTPGSKPYGYMLDLFVLTFATVGIVVTALRRRQRQESVWLLWLAAALPCAFLNMMVIVYGIFGGASGGIGRHYYAALVPMVMLLPAAAVLVFGSRAGVAITLAVFSIVAFRETTVVQHYAKAAYTADVIDRSIPVVDQSWADTVIATQSLLATPPCPARALAIHSGEAPSDVTVAVAGQPPATVHQFGSLNGFTIYVLPQPAQAAIEMRFPKPISMEASTAGRSRSLSVPGKTADPTARIYCDVADPVGQRFRAVYRTFHPDFITYRELTAWPVAWGAVYALLALVATGVAAAAAGRRRRLDNPAAAGGVNERTRPARAVAGDDPTPSTRQDEPHPTAHR